MLANLHGGRLLAAPTPKYSGQTGTPKARSSRIKAANLQTQVFKVAHQRVNLDVDLARKLIAGATEITIIPLSSNLRVVRLDAREMKIKNVYINGSKCTNYIHRDLLYINDPKVFEDCVATSSINLWDVYSPTFSIHHHHLLRQKLNYLFGDVISDQYAPDKFENTNTEELGIILPDDLKLELADLNSYHTPVSLFPTAGMTPLQMRTRNTNTDTYTPIQVGIEYEIVNPKDGVNFMCDPRTNKRNWHVYTVNSEYNVSTSSWVPSIDNLWERNTWSIEISIPRSMKHISDLLLIAHKDEDTMDIDSEPSQKSPNDNNEGEGSSTESKEKENEEDEDDDDSENFDLFVCTGDTNNTKETPHPTDLSKKLVSWSVFNPVCAHHIGWAVGFFQSSELADFSDNSGAPQIQEEIVEYEEEIEKDESTASVMLYYLPGQEELAKNTCIFAHKAVDFFLKEFGSYPFTSYSIAFVSGPNYPYNNFAGLSIFSDSILYPPDVIEPMFETTEDILECIAGQWSSINIVPQVFNDIWCTVGIAKFMSLQFLRVLMGQNQLRYLIKQKMDRIVNEDVGQRPIGLHSLSFPVSEADFSFLRLKAPVILFILDRRMTKTDKSFGLSRVLPKIFLQAMSGDLQNGTLSTQHFQYVCEKVNRNRLESFFKQWVYGVGTPIFNITQRFNKKRSMIEVVIRQAQALQTNDTHPSLRSFIDESLTFLNDRPVYPVQPTFLGPMTIRVHEADGTPYEHIVDIKDSVVKFDVQYNTKFKRLKKSKEENSDANPVFAKLGEILKSDKDLKDWNFEEWPKRDEEFLDPFEWIRVDTDFEWIARFNVKQPDYMFGSQLQQDRDIEAQIAAIEYFGNQEKPNAIYCTALTRTLMDERYFYGVRIAAAKALAEFSRPSNGFAGLGYLIMAFKKLFCFEDCLVPRGNSFEDFGRLFLQKAIPKFMSTIRDDDGNTPMKIKALLFNLLKYNDNSSNDFQDCYYVCDIVESLTEAVIPTSTELRSFDYHMERENAAAVLSDNMNFVEKVIHEINRVQKLDSWVPSYQSKVSFACIKQKIRLACYGYVDFSFQKLIPLTSRKHSYDIRVLAFKGIFLLGGLKNADIMKYFLNVCLLEDSSPYVRTSLIKALLEAVSEAAVYGTPIMFDDPEFQSLEHLFETGNNVANHANLVVFEESQNAEMSTRRDAIARATIKGTIDILRRDLSIGVGLQKTLWELLHSSLIGLIDRKMVFLLCELLYREDDSFPVVVPVPCVPFEELRKKIVAKNLGNGTVMIRREGRFKILLSTKILLVPNKVKSSSKIQPSAGSKNTRTRSNVTAEKEQPQAVPTPVAGQEVVQAEPTQRAKSSVVSRDASNRMSLKISFKNHKLAPLSSPTRSPLRRVDQPLSAETLVSTDNTNVRFLFRSPRTLRRFKSVVAPRRYVKISTRKGRVSLSATPFPEGAELTSVKVEATEETARVESSEAVVKSENEENGTVVEATHERSNGSDQVHEGTTDSNEALTVLPATTSSDEANSNDKQNNAISEAAASREKSAELLEDITSRSKSPFSPEPTSGQTKRKKTKIYIHGQGWQTLSPKSHSPPDETTSRTTEVKEEEVDKPRPKLKLKLTLK